MKSDVFDDTQVITKGSKRMKFFAAKLSNNENSQNGVHS